MEKTDKIYLVFRDGKPCSLGNSRRIAYRSSGHIIRHISHRNLDEYTIKVVDYKNDTIQTFTGKEFIFIYSSKQNDSDLAAIFGFNISVDIALNMFRNNLCNEDIYKKLRLYFLAKGIK